MPIDHFCRTPISIFFKHHSSHSHTQFSISSSILIALILSSCAADKHSRKIDDSAQATERTLLEVQECERRAKYKSKNTVRSSDTSSWIVESINDPGTNGKTCVVTYAPDSNSINNCYSVDLLVTGDKIILRAKKLNLLTQNTTGISVDGKPAYGYSHKTNSGELIVDANHAELIKSLSSGKAVEISFKTDESGVKTLQYDLNGFGDSYRAIGDC